MEMKLEIGNPKKGGGVLDMEVPAVPHVSKFSTKQHLVQFQSRFLINSTRSSIDLLM